MCGMTGAWMMAGSTHNLGRMTDDERAKEIARLEALVTASQGRDGYAARLAAIEAKLAGLRQ